METNTTTFRLNFIARRLDGGNFETTDNITFKISDGTHDVNSVNIIGNKSTQIDIDNGIGQPPLFFIKDISVTSQNAKYIVSYMDGIDWQNNNRKGFSRKNGDNTDVTIWVEYVELNNYNIPPTISPSITGISIYGSYNPLIIYYTQSEWNTQTNLFENFTLTSVTPFVKDYKLNIGQSYNSTFTDKTYIDKEDFIEFKYDAPFRIHNNNNEVVINSQLDSESTITYVAKFNLTRNKNLPYYTTENQIYQIHTEPLSGAFEVQNIYSDNNETLHFTYTNATNDTVSTINTSISNGVTKKFYLNDMFVTNQQLVINSVSGTTSGVFCPYVKTNGTYYYCFNDFIKKSDNITVSPNKTLHIETKVLNYQTVKPNLILPPSISPNYISITYNYINNSIQPYNTGKYQYTILEANKNIQNENGKTSLGSWSNYKYNVGNSDYTLTFKIDYNKNKGGNADDFDVIIDDNNVFLHYDTEVSDSSTKVYKIKPNINNNKYFSDIEPNINIYPKTSINYINDMSLIDINLKYTIDNYTYSATIKGNYTLQPQIKFSYNNKATHTVTIGNINTTNKIEYISVKCNNQELQKIYDIQKGKVLLENNDLKQPITWNLPSITYTFTVVTRSPDTPIEPQQTYAYGITIDGNGIASDFGKLLIALDNDDYIIRGNSEGTISANGNMLTLDSTQVINSQIIYIDGSDCTGNIKPSGTPYVQLYNYNTNYYIKSSLLPLQYELSSDSDYIYKGTIKLRDYISNNISYVYPSQIKFNPISIDYKATLDIINKDHNSVKTIETGIVSTSQSTIVSIPENYVSELYDIAISKITGILSNNQEFNIERYNLNLENLTGELTSYNVYKPIKIQNNTENNVIITNIEVIDKNSTGSPTTLNPNTLLSSGINGYIYYSSYIIINEFKSKAQINNVSLQYYDDTNEDIIINNYNNGFYYGTCNNPSNKSVKEIIIN